MLTLPYDSVTSTQELTIGAQIQNLFANTVNTVLKTVDDLTQNSPFSRLSHDFRIALKQFSYDLQTNPRAILLGYALPVVAAGMAAAAGAGAISAGLAAAKRTKNPKKIIGAAGRGALKGVGL